jgi:hypothetical protein
MANDQMTVILNIEDHFPDMEEEDGGFCLVPIAMAKMKANPLISQCVFRWRGHQVGALLAHAPPGTKPS